MAHLRNPLQRIPSLDGLRAISISLVLFGHILAGRNIPYLSEYGFRDLGALGVRVFFVISGFLITGLLLNEISATGRINFKKFYFRRTLRIFPPFYFFLMVMLAASLSGLTNIPLESFVSAFTYTKNLFHPGEGLLGHSWSLSMEEQFYLAWPFVLFVTGRRRAHGLLWLIIVLCPLARIVGYLYVPTFKENQSWITFGLISNLDSIATGCLLAFMREWLHTWKPYRRVLESALFALLPIFILFAALPHHHPKVDFTIFTTGQNLAIALCLDWAITNSTGFVGKILNSKPFVWVGVLSYSLYLWQQVFLVPSTNVFPLNIIQTFAAALFSYFIIERPSLKLRQRLEKRPSIAALPNDSLLPNH